MNWSFKLLDFAHFIIFIWFYVLNLKLTPLTTILPVCLYNFIISPVLFLSLPEITVTLSPIRTCIFCFILIYKTSGANETIFEKFLSRISRATGPKTRVPLGLLSKFTITAALSSNRIYIPSWRRIVLQVLTTTARTTSERLIGIFGKASLTTPIIVSPTLAYFRFPPNTRIHIIFRAPVLSATVNIVWG